MRPIQTTYDRVIPRDFFNEAKLLKCFGFLSLKILNNSLPEGMQIHIEDNGERFDIELADEGFLYLANYCTTINEVPVLFLTTYNNKSNFPFYCRIDDYDYQVFDEGGNFTDEFKGITI